MYMGSKKFPCEGGGILNLKKKSHKSSHNNFREKVKKKKQGRMAHNFFKDEDLHVLCTRERKCANPVFD